MKNFHYSIPTEVYFGKGQIKNLGKELIKYGKKVLMVYGGGSIKKIGLYDNVRILNIGNTSPILLGSITISHGSPS